MRQLGSSHAGLTFSGFSLSTRSLQAQRSTMGAAGPGEAPASVERLVVTDQWTRHPDRWLVEHSSSTSTLQEIDVEIQQAAGDAALLQRLCEFIGAAAVASRGALRSLRLAGPLRLSAVFQPMAPYAAQFTQLEAVCLARGGADWAPDAAACVLQQLPSLKKLMVRFSFDDEHLPQDLLSVLLKPPAAAVDGAGGAGAPLAPAMPQLQHLALVYPPRSVMPPEAPLPDVLSQLTQLTALKFKRYPVTTTPAFLGELTNLRFLLWDPAHPADAEYTMPPGLGRLSSLECLWIVTQWPLALDTSLAGNLQGLHVMARGLKEGEGLSGRQRWEWLAPFSRLRSLRLQGVGMAELPGEVLDKSQLTRLDLMVNQLTGLQAGPYLRELQFVHLGNNRLAHFPSALLQSPKLEAVYLANQSTGRPASPSGGCKPAAHGSVQRGAGFLQRLEFSRADVEGLLRLTSLATLVVGSMQPQVALGKGRQGDFAWLQRVLKKAGVRLTSHELDYPLQSKAVFELPPLLENNVSSRQDKEEAAAGASDVGSEAGECSRTGSVASSGI